MKRCLVIVAAVQVAALAVLAAPGFSLREYRPAAVDFELAAPAPGATASGGPVVSGVIDAPKRFNLVGLRWRGDGEPRLALRSRREGGAWTRWVPVPAHDEHAPDARSGERAAAGASDPVWVGEADELQYRSSRALPGLRLHFVNVRGTATPGARVATALRGAVNHAVTAVAGTPVAGAQSQPSIVPRAGWGAEQCAPRKSPEYGQVRAAFIHHTVTANDYSPAESPSIVLAVCRYHRNSNGWNDIGYNFLVDKYGTIFEGRAGGIDRAVSGAQTAGLNSVSTGISNVGTFTSLPQSDAALNAMAALIRWKLPLHGAATAGTVQLGSKVVERVSGHRDANATSCPGDALYSQLPALRAKVGGFAPPAPAPGIPLRGGTKIETNVAPGVLAFPARANFRGRLRLRSGQSVADQHVQVQRLGRRGWRSVGGVRTGAGGDFSVAVAAAGKTFFRARFPGNGGLRGSTSKRRIVKVRPAVTLARGAARARTGRSTVVSGRVRPTKRKLFVTVQRKSGGRVRGTGRFPVSTTRGHFRRAFRLPAPGLYRFVAGFPGDAANLPSSSPELYVRAVGKPPRKRAPRRRGR